MSYDYILTYTYFKGNIFHEVITLDKNYIVTKRNKLITCNYDLSVQEQKIILTLASMGGSVVMEQKITT